MKIVDSIMSLLTSKKEPELTDVPEGVCPNCWGQNEYGGAFYRAARGKGINANNASAHVGWVQEYADKYLTNIAIVTEPDSYVCHSCNTRHPKAS